MAHHVSGTGFDLKPRQRQPSSRTCRPVRRRPIHAQGRPLGALFGLLFGASTVYLGLRAGLTVSASIPDRRARHLGAEAPRRLDHPREQHRPDHRVGRRVGRGRRRLHRSPPCIFLPPYGPAYFNYFQITLLRLRRRHPRRADDGAAAAGADRQGARRPALSGRHRLRRRAGRRRAGRQLAKAGLHGPRRRRVVEGPVVDRPDLSRTAIGYTMARSRAFPNATLNVDISPEYMGVGYVIGPRIAGEMFAGGVLSWLVLLPLLTIIGAYMTAPFPPVAGRAACASIDDDAPARSGAPTSATPAPAPCSPSGLITLARTIPTIVSSFRDSVKDFRAEQRRTTRQLRTERDLPMPIVLGGTLLLALFLLAVARGMPTYGNVLATLLVVVFGFFFVTVVVAHRRPDRQFVEPGLGHDHRHADPDLHDLRRARLDRRRLRADRALRSAPWSASRRPTPARRRRTSRPASSSAPRRVTSRPA